MAIHSTSYDNRTLESKTSDNNNDGRAWITAEGRGEGCRTCYSQINVRHVLGSDGRIVTLCTDCRAVYTDGGRR